MAIVAAPHVRTLVKLANLGAKKRIGVLYSTDEQAELIRDSLVNSGLNDIRVLSDTSDAALDAVDVVVVPSEMPQVRNELEGRVETIDFGNVLDESSTRIVAAVIDDLREMRRNSTPEV